MHLEGQVRVGRRMGCEARHRLAHGGVQVGEGRVGAQREVHLHLHGEDEERRLGRQAVEKALPHPPGQRPQRQPQPSAEVDGDGRVQQMRLEMPERPGQDVGQVEGDVPHGLARKAVLEARARAGRLGALGQAPDGVRLAREMRHGVVPVALQDDAVGPQIAVISGGDRDGARLRRPDRNPVIDPLLAQQDEVRDGVTVKEVRDVARPFGQRSREVHRPRPAPEEPVAEAEVDAVGGVATPAQLLRQPGEEGADGALEEEEALHGHPPAGARQAAAMSPRPSSATPAARRAAAEGQPR